MEIIICQLNQAHLILEIIMIPWLVMESLINSGEAADFKLASPA